MGTYSLNQRFNCSLNPLKTVEVLLFWLDIPLRATMFEKIQFIPCMIYFKEVVAHQDSNICCHGAFIFYLFFSYRELFMRIRQSIHNKTTASNKFFFYTSLLNWIRCTFCKTEAADLESWTGVAQRGKFLGVISTW